MSLSERLSALLATQPPDVVAAYLFGSHARGDATSASDIDIAVLFARPPEATLDGAHFTLQGTLERHLGVAVDLVVLNTASADLVHRVLRDGVVVLDRDRAARLRFEVARRNEYFDLEPVRRRYRRPTQPPGR
jgi:predicted nucleotidyltransferase